MAVRARWVAAALAIGLGLSACGGGGSSEPGRQDEATVPLPATAPRDGGEAKGPDLVAKVLLTSNDQADAELGVTGEFSSSNRTSGAVVTDRAVVAYSVDDVGGYSLKTGKRIWTARLDMGTGSICTFSTPESSKVKVVSLTYSTDGQLCTQLVTLSAASGKVVRSVDLGDRSQSGGVADYTTGGVTIGNTDYLLDGLRRVYRVGGSRLVRVGEMAGGSVDGFARAYDSDVVVTEVSDRGTCRLEGYTFAPFKRVWAVDARPLLPPGEKECPLHPLAHDGSWVLAANGTHDVLIKVDAATGRVIGSRSVRKPEDVPQGRFNQSYATNLSDDALGVKGGDLVTRQPTGLARFSMRTKRLVWSFDGSALSLGDGPETDAEAFAEINPRAVTSDGKYLLATLTNAVSCEILALDVRTGRLVGRWRLPSKYSDGFAVEPRLALFDGGVVLTRDFEKWRSQYNTVEDAAGTKRVFDVGIFAWPRSTD